MQEILPSTLPIINNNENQTKTYLAYLNTSTRVLLTCMIITQYNKEIKHTRTVPLVYRGNTPWIRVWVRMN